MILVRYGMMSIPSPDREPLRSALLLKLNRKVDVSMDYSFSGPGANFVACLETLLQSDTEFVCLMQDDLLASKFMCDAIETAGTTILRGSPNSVLCFYSNTSKSKKAVLEGKSFFKYPLTGSNYVWVCCILIPASIAAQFCAYYRSLQESDSFPEFARGVHRLPEVRGKQFIHDDVLFSHFLKTFGFSAYCSTYSLVQHAGGLTSSLGHKFAMSTGKNVAHNFIGEDADARRFLVAK